MKGGTPNDVDVERQEVTEAGPGHRMRGDARREQLLRVALGIFASKGFRGTTTKEIAAAAGVTEALIFRYFPTKDALYEATLWWRIDAFGFADKMLVLREIAERRDDEGLLRAIAKGMLEFHSTNVDLLRLMFYAGLENHALAEAFRERHIRPFNDFLAEYIATRQREGAFRDVDPPVAVRLILGMPFHHSIQKNLFQCNLVPVSDEEAVESFVRIALGGLRRAE
jgi:AcrR family transcriptional regulator